MSHFFKKRFVQIDGAFPVDFSFFLKNPVSFIIVSGRTYPCNALCETHFLMYESEELNLETKKTRFGNLKRFFQLLSESLWSLVKLNLIFLLTCLPVITIGPALTALSGCIQELIQGDVPEETPLHSYWRIFRSCFKKSILWGLLALLGSLILGNAFLYYLGQASTNGLYLPLASLTLVSLLFLLGILSHLFVLLGIEDTGTDTASCAPAKTPLFKAAAIHAAMRMGKTLLCLLLSAALLFAQVYFLPNTFPLLLLIGISIPAVICGFGYKDAPEYGA